MSVINRSEEFVYQVCKKSFLSLWSYPNPRGKKGKELCDILVVCDPDIIIFSVKEVKLSKSGDVATDWERWQKRAIEQSCQQIYGAERWIADTDNIIHYNGTIGLPFPSKGIRRIHRVAVALGSEGEVSIKQGDFGKGFVHVFDEDSFRIILSELDTITDFVNYLVDKEKLFQSGASILFTGLEEDILGLYLIHNRSFLVKDNLIIAERGLWDKLANNQQYRAKKTKDIHSYFWDELIEFLSNDFTQNNLEVGFEAPLSESEIIVRYMAREDRFSRRILTSAFQEFLFNKNSRARLSSSPQSGLIYVYLKADESEGHKYVSEELQIRCFIARGLNINSKTIIGLAHLTSKIREGGQWLLCYIHKDEWDEEDQVLLLGMQRDLGFFVNPKLTRIDEDEYPSSN